jgi:hypothetical protein
MAMQRASEATNKSKEKEPLGVEQKAIKSPKEKTRYLQSIITKEDVFVAAPQPNLQESIGYGGLMGFVLTTAEFCESMVECRRST